MTLDGRITFWNAAAQHLYGYPAEEAIGAGIAMLVPPGEEDEISPCWNGSGGGNGRSMSRPSGWSRTAGWWMST